MRQAFEARIFAYYQNLKVNGWSHPDEGDNTPEALFWRQPNGQYGVHQIEAAWQGWQLCNGEALNLLKRAASHIEYFDGTTTDNEKLIDDYRAFMKGRA